MLIAQRNINRLETAKNELLEYYPGANHNYRISPTSSGRGYADDSGYYDVYVSSPIFAIEECLRIYKEHGNASIYIELDDGEDTLEEDFILSLGHDDFFDD